MAAARRALGEILARGVERVGVDGAAAAAASGATVAGACASTSPTVPRSAMYNNEMQDIIRRLLAELGEDPSREGLLDTPKRVEKSLRFLTSGYSADVDSVLNNALFTVDYNEMVIVKDIDFYSLCEHHLLPFFGKCHVAYIPQGRVIGLSKIPRLVDIFARRLQIQERLTSQIAETLLDKVQPMGVAVVMEATHICACRCAASRSRTRSRSRARCSAYSVRTLARGPSSWS